MTDPAQAYVEEHQERFVEELKGFMRFPSISVQRAHDGDTRRCAEWLRDHLHGLGLQAELVDIGGQPIVKAAARGRRARRVMIYGHYDVQPEDPVDWWESPAFEPAVRDGKLYGRGAVDDKGQLFAHIKAVESLLKTEGELPCEVVFLIEGEEESGGDALARYVRRARDELRPDAVVISDTTMYDENTPAITYSLRGILTFELTVHGPRHDLHSGAYGGAVVNPAAVLARMLASCLGPDGRIQIRHFYDEVAPLAPWEAQEFRRLDLDSEALAREVGVPRPDGEVGYSTLERLWARPTFEVNGLFGGYQGAGSKTIVPATATAKISSRLVPNQDPARIRQAIVEHLRSVCPDTVRLEISEFAMSPPLLFDVNHPALHAAKEALEQGFGREAVFIRCGGSIPVVSTFVEQFGCPVVLMGFGLDTNRPHSPNEHIRLADFIRGAKSAAHLLRTI